MRVRRSNGQFGERIWIAVVDVSMGNQHPIGIIDFLRSDGDGHLPLQVRTIENLCRIGQVGIDINHSPLEYEPTARLT